MSVMLRFVVDLTGQALAPYERVFVFGNAKELGLWNVNGALALTRTDDYNVWQGEVSVPDLITVRYRYFVGAMQQPRTGKRSTMQVRYWETQGRAREYNMNGSADICRDKFGNIDGSESKVSRGWLNTGQIILFKLYNAFLKHNCTEQLHLLLEAVDPCTLAPIMPSPCAHIHYTLLGYGNSTLQEQPRYGIPYGQHGFLIFHITTLDKDKVAYLFKLFVCNTQSNFVRLLNQQFLPSTILERSEGAFSLKFKTGTSAEAKTQEFVTLRFEYLVIESMPNWQVGLSATLVDYWPKHWQTFHVGHRGMGRSYVPQNAAKITENTIGSMVESYEVGADMVEFDVMVTRDLVPVIYHDFGVQVSKCHCAPSSQADLRTLLIKDLYYEELRNLKTYQVFDEHIVEYPAANTVLNEKDRLFPTLADFFTKVDKMLGFDIEIKWPQTLYCGNDESVQTVDKNLYLDAILSVVQRFGWGRVCFFTSFDADICIMLRYKQNIYPVLMLLSNKRPEFVDPRTHCLYPAINTTQAFELRGIVSNANIFKEHPETVEVAKRQNKLLMLWGDLLRDRNTIEQCKKNGIHAVIYDRLDTVLGENKQNSFIQDVELKQLLTLQYSCYCK